jgi:hypothetical protein
MTRALAVPVTLWSRDLMYRLFALAAAGMLAACSSDSTGPGNPPPAPSSLTSTSLDGAVALDWPDNAFEADPSNFSNYVVYSTSYNLDQDQCGSSWNVEGTTVAPEFIVGALTNGIPRCFTVSAVSVGGSESGQSPLRNDTPRPDARNVVIYARQYQNSGSGFRFWEDLNGNGTVENNELGLALAGSDAAADFTVERDGAGNLFLTPARTGTTVALYGSLPVEDLTSIDLAPINGYDAAGLEALPGWGYVFQMTEPDAFFRYGAVRVTHVGQNFLILDWAYQTDPGNPELLVAGRAR